MPAGGFGAVLGFEAIAAGEIARLIPVAGEDTGLAHGERVSIKADRLVGFSFSIVLLCGGLSF